MAQDALLLKNQICFPLYAASRLVTREYQPHLDEIGLTYPQYLAMMVLWEEGEMAVKDIAEKLILNTNTVTPLLKRMEKRGLVVRKRSRNDERRVLIGLTPKGAELKGRARKIPEALAAKMEENGFSRDELAGLKAALDRVVDRLGKSYK